MSDLTISVFGNQSFLEIIKNIELFSKYKIKFYDDLTLCTNDAVLHSHLVILFLNEKNKEEYKKMKEISFPLILITESSKLRNIFSGKFIEYLNAPFSVFELEKKIVILSAKCQFEKSSLINLGGYIIDKNERKIKKNNTELQLTEKEINFLVMFNKYNKPLNRNFVLKHVWNYSPNSNTHTVETHIHRLRKKILEKFNDKNFIKNNDKGYYI